VSPSLRNVGAHGRDVVAAFAVLFRRSDQCPAAAG
jgi:hypothetical protein